MLEQLQSEEDGESSFLSTESRTRQQSARPDPRSPVFRLGRLLFGGILAFMAVDNLQNLEERIEYAKGKGAPMPDVSVPMVSGLLLAGGVGVTLWRLPRVSAAAVAGFFASVTPVMHDFWKKEDQERQQQMLHFLKNSALLGAALGFLKLAIATKRE